MLRRIVVPNHIRKAKNCIRSAALVHTDAQSGFTAEAAKSYESGRPNYTAESLEQIFKVLDQIKSKQTSNALNVLELGAGTGKFTESFSSFYESNNLQKQYSLSYLATEPSDGFRENLDNKQLANVRTAFATGEAIPVSDKSQDAIFIAQAFHWMANPSTVKEMHRVLKPGGAIFLIWNTYDYCKDWLRIIDSEILTPTYGDTPRQQTELWRNCFFSPDTIKLFSSLHGFYAPYEHHGDREMLKNRFFSTSVIFKQPEQRRNEIFARINQILDHHPEFEESRKSGKYTVPYVTQLVWAYSQ